MNRKTILKKKQHKDLTYLLLEETLDDRSSYSIAICSPRRPCAFAADVTDNREAALRFLNLISEGGLDPIHLDDVLEDMLPLY